jgi:phosphate acyltransferase
MTERGVERPAPRVVLDAMGGDHAPRAAVRGAVMAIADGIDVVLVGRRDLLDEELTAAGVSSPRPLVLHSDDVVEMGEEPARALRTKRDASIRMAVRMVAAGDADAVVSAGSTGATLAAALLELGRIEGIRRPAVGVVIPLDRGTQLVLVDAGASPDVQPDAIASYAVMGSAYASALAIEAPRVGLLNVGREAGKGNELARQAYEVLRATDGFVGNVEPGGALSGDVDVVVTDGFTGNIFLKTVEALATASPAAATRPPAPGGPGAAALLGVRGDVLVAHGAAREAEIAAALHTAAEVAAAGLSERLAERLAVGEDARLGT